MGAVFSFVDEILQSYLGDKAGMRVLDVGSQNLYGVSAEQAKAFIRRYTKSYDDADLQRYCEILAHGASYDPQIGGLNGAWLGDLLDRAGMEYVAYDIFQGYGTKLLDLNREAAPIRYRDYFDLVLNLGTTEHVIGQANAFEVIHDSCKPGGIMVHRLPSVGWMDHGYFNYQPQFFKDIAEANQYEILELGLGDPGAEENVNDTLINKYQGYIKNLDHTRGAWKDRGIPRAGVKAVLRKTGSGDFRHPLEISTTVGPVAARVLNHKGTSSLAEAQAQQDEADRRVWDALEQALWRLGNGKVKSSEIHDLYSRWEGSSLSKRFPLSLEEQSLTSFISRVWARDRMQQVQALLTSEYPLLKYLPEASQPPQSLQLDGREDWLGNLSGEALQDAVLQTYKAYREKLAVELFPLRFEYAALAALSRNHPDDTDLKRRLSTVLSDLSCALEIGKGRRR